MLKEFRQKARITQKEAADLIGVDERTVRRWESGETNPSLADIPKIKEAYRLTQSQVMALISKPAKESA